MQAWRSQTIDCIADKSLRAQPWRQKAIARFPKHTGLTGRTKTFCGVKKAHPPCRFRDLQANADSKVAPLQSRRPRLQAELGAFEYLQLEASLGVALLCRDGKTLKPAERNLVRSRQKQEAHCFLTLQPLTGAWLPHGYVLEPLISYIVALDNVLVVCADGKGLAGCVKYKFQKYQKRFFSPLLGRFALRMGASLHSF